MEISPSATSLLSYTTLHKPHKIEVSQPKCIYFKTVLSMLLLKSPPNSQAISDCNDIPYYLKGRKFSFHIYKIFLYSSLQNVEFTVFYDP